MGTIINPELFIKIIEEVDLLEYASTKDFKHINVKDIGINYQTTCKVCDSDQLFIEKNTPQFTCHNCGISGNVIDYHAAINRIPFWKAAYKLGEENGFPLINYDASQKDIKIKKRAMMQEIANYCFSALTELNIYKANEKSFEFIPFKILSERMSFRELNDWNIGYAPGIPMMSKIIGYKYPLDIKTHLLNKGFSIKQMIEEGLVKPNIHGTHNPQDPDDWYVTFRDQFIFPIKDYRDKIVGFAGRTIDDMLAKQHGFKPNEKIPKYINPPTTGWTFEDNHSKKFKTLYEKNKLLFGLNKAINNIRINDLVIATEGYIDVTAAHKAGLDMTVGVCSSQMTTMQLKTLSRLTNKIIFIYDGDPAGIRGMKKNAEMAYAQGMTPSFVILKKKTDLDDLCRTAINENRKLSINDLEIIDMCELYLRTDKFNEVADPNYLDNLSLDDKLTKLKRFNQAIRSSNDTPRKIAWMSKMAHKLRLDDRTIEAMFIEGFDNKAYPKHITYTPENSFEAKFLYSLFSVNGITAKGLLNSVDPQLFTGELKNIKIAIEELISKFENERTPLVYNISNEPVTIGDEVAVINNWAYNLYKTNLLEQVPAEFVNVGKKSVTTELKKPSEYVKLLKNKSLIKKKKGLFKQLLEAKLSGDSDLLEELTDKIVNSN